MRPSNIEAILDGLKHGFELIIIDLPLIRMMTPGYALSPHLDGVALIARTTKEMEPDRKLGTRNAGHQRIPLGRRS